MGGDNESKEFVAQDVPFKDSGVFCSGGLNIAVEDAFNFLSQEEVWVNGFDVTDEQFVELLPQLGEMGLIAAASL